MLPANVFSSHAARRQRESTHSHTRLRRTRCNLLDGQPARARVRTVGGRRPTRRVYIKKEERRNTSDATAHSCVGMCVWVIPPQARLGCICLRHMCVYDVSTHLAHSWSVLMCNICVAYVPRCETYSLLSCLYPLKYAATSMLAGIWVV